MSEERLELVTRFEDLKAGDLTFTLDCACGAAWCPSKLTTLGVDDVDGEPIWTGEPPCFDPDDGAVFGVGPYGVETNCVYRLVAPPVAETRETSRPKVRKRVK